MSVINLLVQSLSVTWLHHFQVQTSLLRRSNTNRLPSQGAEPGCGFSQPVRLNQGLLILILKIEKSKNIELKFVGQTSLHDLF